MTDIELIEAKRTVIETFCRRLDGYQKSRCMQYYKDWVPRDEESLKGSIIRYIPALYRSIFPFH